MALRRVKRITDWHGGVREKLRKEDSTNTCTKSEKREGGHKIVSIREDLMNACEMIEDILITKGTIYSSIDLRSFIAGLQLDDIFTKEYIMKNNLVLPTFFQEIKSFLWTQVEGVCGWCGASELPLEEYEQEYYLEGSGIVCASCVSHQKTKAERD